jgi:hypothetical protein
MSREALIAAREALIGHGAECKEVNDALALIDEALEQRTDNMKSTIDMAREAGLAPICEGCDVPDVSYAYESWDEELKAFEALVRADERSVEREACALACESIESDGYPTIEQQQCANAIRARGNI